MQGQWRILFCSHYLIRLIMSTFSLRMNLHISTYSKEQGILGLFNFATLQVPRPLVWLWKTKCVMKIEVFAWLFWDRLNTRDMLDRRHCPKADDNLTCVMCGTNQRETREHLFFSCPSSTRCWQFLGISWSPQLEFFSNDIFGKMAFHSS